jgi:hypothetical protein
LAASAPIARAPPRVFNPARSFAMSKCLSAEQLIALGRKIRREQVLIGDGYVWAGALTIGERNELNDRRAKLAKDKGVKDTNEQWREMLLYYGCQNDAGTRVFEFEDIGKLTPCEALTFEPVIDKIAEINGWKKETEDPFAATSTTTPTSSDSSSSPPSSAAATAS